MMADLVPSVRNIMLASTQNTKVHTHVRLTYKKVMPVLCYVGKVTTPPVTPLWRHTHAQSCQYCGMHMLLSLC